MKIHIPNADSLQPKVEGASNPQAVEAAISSQIGRILAALPAAGRVSGSYGRRNLALRAKSAVVFKAPAESAPETKAAVIAATLWGSLQFAPINSISIELAESLASALERKFPATEPVKSTEEPVKA